LPNAVAGRPIERTARPSARSPSKGRDGTADPRQTRDEITVSAALFKGLSKAKVDAYRGSIYGLFETQFGVRMLKAREKLRAVPADAAAARILEVRPGDPLLAVDRVTLTYGDRPVEWRRGLCTTRHCHYVNELG